ncbi:MAG TPA: glutathione S-transferase [Casimicrobiaceae bacterium]|nr:glutathione S-transferase [Casimicrobiaceae bacterium]
MKLFHSATSPYVRQCMVAAHELGLVDRVELVPANASPINRDRTVVARNPLGKVPTMIDDDGVSLHDSRVIIDYLNDLGEGDLIPRNGPERWAMLTEQSMADGMLDAALLARYETFLRPEPLRWNDWISGQLEKVASGLAELEARAMNFGDRVDVGTIAFGCMLGYLDFRFSQLEWRDKHPNTAAWFVWFGGRESMMATRPPAA